MGKLQPVESYKNSPGEINDWYLINIQQQCMIIVSSTRNHTFTSTHSQKDPVEWSQSS